MMLNSLLPLALVVPALAAKRNFPHHKILNKRADKYGSAMKPGFFGDVVNEAIDVIDSIGVNVGAAVGLDLDLGGFHYGKDKIRGVNLGGWFVLEKWLMPDVFNQTGNPNITDEWTWGELQPRKQAERLSRQHWDTWITEDDIAQIAANGLNHVRIPLGYWAWEVGPGEPYVQGQLPYLDRAIQWCRNHKIKVMIDLHGVPGSQNGNDHSGRAGDIDWYKNATNVQRTLGVITKIAQKYATPVFSDTVTMIELINEPSLWVSDEFKEVLKQYYLDAYDIVRWPYGKAGPKSDIVVVLQDGFQPMSWWGDFMTGPEYTRVFYDNHYYQAFTDYYGDLDAAGHINTTCNEAGKSFADAQLPIIDGEWSMGIIGCQPNMGKATPDVGTCNINDTDYNSDYTLFNRAYWDTQTQIYEEVGNGQGWFYWTWKNHIDSAEWGYANALQRGWFPRDPSQHLHGLKQYCTITETSTNKTLPDSASSQNGTSSSNSTTS